MMNYKIPLKEMLFMNLRGVPVLKIKKELKKAKRYSLELDYMDLQCHYLAEGDITDLVDSMVFAKEHGMVLSFQTAAVGQFLAKSQDQVSLLEKIRIMKVEGVDDVEDYLRSGSSQSELDNA